MTGTHGDLLGSAEAITGMVCAILYVALDSLDMLTLAVGTSFIFHYSILLSDFCSYVSQAGVN